MIELADPRRLDPRSAVGKSKNPVFIIEEPPPPQPKAEELAQGTSGRGSEMGLKM